MAILMLASFVKTKTHSLLMKKGIYCVADGVGGLPFGNLASRLAVKFLSAMIQGREDCTTKEELRDVSFQIHEDIVECGQLVGGENGIGTTFCDKDTKDKFIFAHVGDSLIYHNRGSGFQKSPSVTLGDELIEKHGPEAADDMPEHYMHTLTRCMGQDIDFS